jgi:hypothetical protein
VTFLADLLEDFLMLIIALGYPYFQYPNLMQLLTWMSFLKFLGWGGCVVLGCWIMWGVKNTVGGSRNGGGRLHR